MLPFSPRLLFLSDAIIVTALDTYRGTADSQLQDVSQCVTAAINLDMLQEIVSIREMDWE